MVWVLYYIDLYRRFPTGCTWRDVCCSYFDVVLLSCNMFLWNHRLFVFLFAFVAFSQVFQRPVTGAAPPAEGGPPANPHGFIVSSEPSVCDALLAVSALINASGPAVAPFAGEVADLLLLQMRHQHEPQEAAAPAASTTDSAENDSSTPDELQAARICIELVGDLSRALGADFGGIADPLLHQFYQLLKVKKYFKS